MVRRERWFMETVSRIAVVEDDPEISRMMVGFMTDHGFEVSAARTGRDLDRVMSSGKIDCVILDVGLPGEDGRASAGGCAGNHRCQSLWLRHVAAKRIGSS